MQIGFIGLLPHKSARHLTRILLVAPIKEKYGGLLEAPPLGLGYLATALRKQRYDVSILDCLKENFTSNDFKRFIMRNDFDVIGFNVFSATIEQVKKSLEIIKEVKPNTITIVGGPHPSAAPERTLQFMEKADFAFRGEGEIGFPLFVGHLEKGRADLFKDVPGLVWRENGEIISNNPIIHPNLDDFDFPSWDLIRPNEYGQPGSVVPKGWTSIITSRGCPFQCTFCSTSVITGQKIRFRSIDKIIEEIKYLYKTYNISRFTILDENFTLVQSRVEEFCQKIMDEGVGFKFMLPNGVRLQTLNEQVLGLMKNAGFSRRMAVGIESGSDRILEMIKKNLTTSEVTKKIDLMNKTGFKPIGYFILGFPTETKEEMQQTIDFAMHLKLYRAAFTCLIPFPGTEIYNTLQSNHEIPYDFDFTNLTTDSVNYAPTGITIEDLMKIRKRAVLRFHLRPRVILDFMQDYSSFKFAFTKFMKLLFRSAPTAKVAR